MSDRFAAREPSWPQAPLASVSRRHRGHGAHADVVRRVMVGALSTFGALLALLPAWSWQRLTRTDSLRSVPGWSPRRRSAGALGAGLRRPSVPLAPAQLIARVCLALVLVGVVLVATERGRGLVDRVTSGSAQVATPFRLAPEPDDVAVPAEGSLPLLDHPVPDDLEANPAVPGEVPAAMKGEAWYVDGYRTAQGWSFQQDTVWRPALIYPVLDFRGAGLSVRDGLRPTWQPPPCSCPTVTVWMYGGSTAYGMNQRDEHTIASELARFAHVDGIRLEVQNRGVLGYLHWLEAERFSYDLTIDPPPDVVLFYDGVNETWAASALNNRASGDIGLPVDPTMIDVWGYTGRADGPTPAPPPGAYVIGWDRSAVLPMRSLARTTVERYDRSRQISQGVAHRHGVRPLYVWQPSRVSRQLIAEEPHGNADEENYVRMRDQLQREYLPDDVIDVVDALDADTSPIFTDDVHHNEHGARLIAEAIYSNIASELRDVARTRDQSG